VEAILLFSAEEASLRILASLEVKEVIAGSTGKGIGKSPCRMRPSGLFILVLRTADSEETAIFLEAIFLRPERNLT
jgi:hypothetical protein